MREFFSQIRKGLDANLYFLSLFSVLTIPDLCGAMNSENGEASAEKYKSWFDKYVASKYGNFLTAGDCYFFRCSLLHQGSSQHPKSNYKRVLFVEPQATTNIFHKVVINDALNIDVRIFCDDIISSAEMWLDEIEKQNYIKRIIICS